MNILSSQNLPDGSLLEVCRVITPDPAVPEEVVRYMIASLGYDTWRNAVNELAYWRLYYREALAGNSAPGVIDHLYLARVNGVYAARVWFAYSTRTGHGNFGNVFTEPEFRNRGLMKHLLQPCIEDFHASPAAMLCCTSGNPHAVPSYLKSGFVLIYGGTGGPLCLRKQGTFQEAESAAYPGGEPCSVRAGVLADQFECDKFLAYTRPMYRHPRDHRIGIASFISDYRIAFQEVLSGSGVVNAAETPSGAVAGYAFALRLYGQCVLDFRIHPAYIGAAAELLARTRDGFESKFQEKPCCFIASGDTEREAAVRSAGLVEAGKTEGFFTVYR